MNFELYDCITETLEIMGDPALMEALQASLSEIQNGQTIPWENVKQELNLK
jgi:hypothetical protein